LTITTDQTGPSIDAERLAELKTTLGGLAVSPGQPDYDQAVRLWNGMIDLRPSIVVQPTGVADIKQAIRFAREQDLEIAIKGGGHSVAGLSTTNGGLMLDLERMRGVRVDPERRTARVAGGARWADFDREASAFGLVTTGGVISTTGVAGLTLGGGVGWLVGKHGLASDNLLSVDIVTADGELVTASAESRPDLFWALRGGGGNFGVATSFEFQLHPQPMVYAGMTAHAPERARELLGFYRELTATAPDELTIYCDFSRDPESGQRAAALAFCWSGTMEEAEAALGPLLEFGPPILTIAEPMPYAAWNGALDAAFPSGRRYYWKSALMRELDDRVLDAVAELGAAPPLPWVSVTVENYTGAMNRQPADATAFPHRDAHYQIVIVGAWDDPADDDAGRQWARDIHAAVAPYAKEGDFLNFSTVDASNRQERTHAGYGEHWERLVEVKRRYDPDNVFHRNNNVTPG
jgi:FAD/FMN-containing dehydrogenase